LAGTGVTRLIGPWLYSAQYGERPPKRQLYLESAGRPMLGLAISESENTVMHL
jgi:hypothetical protein